MCQLKALLIVLMAAWLICNIPGTGAAQQMIFPGAEWETATPESQGINSLRLNSAVEYLHPNFNSPGRELVITRNGRLVWGSPGSHVRQEVASVTKSFNSTILGLLIDDGNATLQTRAADFVPSLVENYADVTLRHLATLTSGYQTSGAFGTPAYWEPVTPFFPPGSQFYYTNPAMDQFANAMTQIAGERIDDLFRRRIADPIGMSGWYWRDHSPNNPPGSVAAVNIAGWGLQVSARDAARFGHLFLNRGQWDGQQLISTEWVDEATRVQVPNSLPIHPDSPGGVGPGVYGYNWWCNGDLPNGSRVWPDAPADSYVAIGLGDDRIRVVPEWNMVIVKTADDPRDEQLWNAFYRQIGKSLVPEIDGANFDLAPGVVYDVRDNTFDDLGDLAIDVTGDFAASIGETDATTSNYLSRVVAKFLLPEAPAGTPILRQATLGFRPVSIEGPPIEPISVWHSQSDNDMVALPSTYEDPSYINTMGEIIQPNATLSEYYDLDVTNLVLDDYASDGPDPISAFRLQLDGASYVEDDLSHLYELSMPGATYRPQLLLTFSAVPEPTTLLLCRVCSAVAVFLCAKRGRILVVMLAVAVVWTPVPVSAITFGQWATNQGYSPDDAMPEEVNASDSLIDSLDGIGDYNWTATPTTALRLWDNQLSSIETGTFSGLTSLEGLYLGYNQISNIEPGAFSGLTNLDELQLAGNQLSTIEPGIFSRLPNLRSLHLSGNQISSIEVGAFSGLTNLGWLYLTGNQISRIEPGFAGLTNLVVLILPDNRITSVESGAFSGLTNLGMVNLNYNHDMAELNLARAEFLSLGMFTLSENYSLRTVSLKNAVVNQLSFFTLMDGGGFHTPIGTVPGTGIGELEGIIELDLSGIDFVDITDLSPLYPLDDLTDLWLVGTTNMDALQLDVVLDELDTMQAIDIEGVLYMTQRDYDAFNTAGGGLLETWHSEQGHHVEFVPEPTALLLCFITLVLLWPLRSRGALDVL